MERPPSMISITPTTYHLPALLTYRQVCDMLQISRRTLERMVARQAFPQPLKLSKRSARFRREDILSHLAKLAR
jgi:excisionase family DNA binding protein